jgi:putative ABC transport system permease protein
MLIVAAGLFTRTFATLATRDLGFDRKPVVVTSINVQPLQIEPTARMELWRRLRAAAANVPGVASLSLSVVTPISNNAWNDTIDRIDGKPTPGGTMTYINMVSPDYFATYGTRMLAGRDFTDYDVRGGSAVAIVNETFARTFMGGANPIGHRVHQIERPNAPTPDYEIVGLVVDAAYESARQRVPPTMYLSFWQTDQPLSSASLSVRASAGAPMLLTRSLTSALTSVNPGVALTFRPLADQVNASLTQERLVATLSGFFGGLALLLAGLGLYGVTSYAVSRRRTEIGIRMALGAAPGGVIAMVLTRVLTLVMLGIVCGAGASVWASQYVTTLLFELHPRDPLTLIGSALVLATIGTLAGWIPARRAARIDPAEVLRL